ncbi:MAG: L-threonylcarbamoyladenylate synthase [Chitinophagales bacterium]
MASEQSFDAGDLKSRILRPDAEGFRVAAQAIKDGKIVIVPTYTIYVLVCDAFNAEPLAKLRALRKSPADKPITIVMDKTRVPEFAEVDERQRKIMDIFLPSPVSLYVQKRDSRLDAALTYSDAIVVWYQDCEVGTLYKEHGDLLGISSSNFKGLPDATTLEEAIAYFGDEVDYYMDGGPARGIKPSAHIDIREKPVKLMREAPHYPLSKIRETLAQYGLE